MELFLRQFWCFLTHLITIPTLVNCLSYSLPIIIVFGSYQAIQLDSAYPLANTKVECNEDDSHYVKDWRNAND